MKPESHLDSLRSSIADLDRQMLELLSQRMRLAEEVGRIKAETGAPIIVAEVEQRVLARAHAYAEQLGVSEEVLGQIFRAIIDAAVERQHRVGIARRAEQGERVLVIGGSGGMGGWFLRFLPLVGHRVSSVDPEPGSEEVERFESLDRMDDLDAFDSLIVSVPLRTTAVILEQLIERKPRGRIVELCSVKQHLEPTIRRARESGLSVSCLHPMFGPGKSPYEPLTFVLACHGELEAERVQIEALLRHPYTRWFPMPFDHHDRLMGWLLGLAHFHGMLFGAALTHSGLDPTELSACASTTYKRQVDTALSVLNEDPQLYLDIQRLNPYREEIYAAVRKALDQVVGGIRRGDPSEFASLLRESRSALRGS